MQPFHHQGNGRSMPAVSDDSAHAQLPRGAGRRLSAIPSDASRASRKKRPSRAEISVALRLYREATEAARRTQPRSRSMFIFAMLQPTTAGTPRAFRPSRHVKENPYFLVGSAAGAVASAGASASGLAGAAGTSSLGSGPKSTFCLLNKAITPSVTSASGL